MLYRNRVNTGTYINILPCPVPTQVPIASGTIMLFQQTSAPTGWTKLTAHDNKTLRVVSGTAGSGGTTAFSTALTAQTMATSIVAGSTTLDQTQIPLHTHFVAAASVTYKNSNTNGGYYTGMGSGSPSGSTAPIGGGQSHTHASGGSMNSTLDLAVLYVDIIMASKN
jgi:hypothetical protein